jgi:hypothetical protein
MDERRKDEVLATYTAFLTAFRANDVQAINELFQYPCAYIGNGQTTLLDTFPIKPAELMAAKQWHDTRDFSYEVVFTSADKAHLIVRQATRVRSDGSPIETVSAFYALTRGPSRWKFCLLRHHHPCVTQACDSREAASSPSPPSPLDQPRSAPARSFQPTGRAPSLDDSALHKNRY